MNKLWDYEDYVKHLSHTNGLVRRWAMRRLEHRYPNRYADDVRFLIDDEDEHLVCDALRYLSRHKANQHAPAILEKFKQNTGIIASNSVTALGRMHYEPAMDTILDFFHRPDSQERFLGMLNYLGSVQTEQSREALRTAVTQLDEPYLYRPVMQRLLLHRHTEDIDFVMDKIFDSAANDEFDGLILRDLSSALESREYFDELTFRGDENIWSKPETALENFLHNNSHIGINPDFHSSIIDPLQKVQYGDFAAALMSDARNAIQSRYPTEPVPDSLKNLNDQDAMCLSMMETLSKRSSVWKGLKKDDYSELIPFALSLYCTIIERGVYAIALTVEDVAAEELIKSLQQAGPSLPPEIQTKIIETVPANDLKRTLSDELESWCDIWTVRIMGRTGNIEFVPELIRVFRDADSLDLIYSDAKDALSAMGESIDETLLEAAQSEEMGDWESFALLERLPYSESYDTAIRRWESDDCDLDSYELFAMCLRDIGDIRGIDTLRDIYHNENNAGYIGDAIECLGELHEADIPEISEIREERQKQKEFQKARREELDEIARQYNARKKEKDLVATNVVPFKRDKPKVGRNEPCPCGSGKKYKKCCLDKE